MTDFMDLQFRRYGVTRVKKAMSELLGARNLLTRGHMGSGWLDNYDEVLSALAMVCSDMEERLDPSRPRPSLGRPTPPPNS